MFGIIIDYWYFTGDASYNSVFMQELLFQSGQIKTTNCRTRPNPWEMMIKVHSSLSIFISNSPR